MKLTADLILQSPQFTNALRDRELDLRGKFYLCSLIIELKINVPGRKECQKFFTVVVLSHCQWALMKTSDICIYSLWGTTCIR